ncbi:hypothetical protein SCALM49S_07649 [Streptomyces californicus]
MAEARGVDGRRDVDRLRELGYPVVAFKGPEGGYRLDAGASLPPLLFDDDQAVALTVALRTAAATGAGIGESAARALTTVRQVMPARLRHRVDALRITAVERTGVPPRPQADPRVLLALSSAVHAGEVLRFGYSPAYAPAAGDGGDAPPGATGGAAPPGDLGRALGIIVAWDLDREDWRIFRADRIEPRTPTGPRFPPREVPGGDVAAFVAARFQGSEGPGAWPCSGRGDPRRPGRRGGGVHVRDGIVEEDGPVRCRVVLGGLVLGGAGRGSRPVRRGHRGRGTRRAPGRLRPARPALRGRGVGGAVRSRHVLRARGDGWRGCRRSSRRSRTT